MKICSECNFTNQDQAQYCQHCGALLKETKRSIKTFIKSFVKGKKEEDVLAKAIIGLNLDGSSYSKVTQSHTLEDGSWFCPYCGQKNKAFQFTCSKCIEQRP